MHGNKPLPSSQLYHSCDLSKLRFEDSAELQAPGDPIGQQRALEAVEFGVQMPHEGYNLYLMGSSGLGKHRLIEQTLEQHRRQAEAPCDWCYIANFAEPHRPFTLRLPSGRGIALRADVRQLLEDLLNAIPAAFHSTEYNQRAEAINSEFKEREEKIAETLGKRARDRDIALIHTPNGYTLAPVHNGHILSNEEFDKLPDDEQEKLQSTMEDVKDELKQTMGQVPLWQRELRKRFKALDREVTLNTVTQLVLEIEERYKDLPQVLDYLEAYKQDVVDNFEAFRAADGDSKSVGADEAAFNRYRVNLLVDNAGTSGAPVVYENNPTYVNLVGRIEHISRMGALLTDFTLIKAGALHRANGGYLILDAIKLLTNGFAWEALKRMLRSREIRIESVERLLSLTGTSSLEPQTIPLDVKVVLVGERLLYYLLDEYDPEFGQLFKVAADFSEDMPRHTDNDFIYARFIASLQQREKLRPLSRPALERTVEQAARWAMDGDRLSLDVRTLLDLIKESDYWASKANGARIDADHVQIAIDARKRRMDQLRERILEEILRGSLLIDSHGVQLGRINGLTVIQTGDYAFGMPTRISATARLGNGEVVDIQREVDQGGPIHSKGVLILSAYLARRYAKYQPLCLSATLAFEQTYGGIEGDSASTAELCALLSAIGDLPLKQSFAITGSVNQHGEVQAIGGVNEKIEGWFDLCQSRGLSGEHGVIIPEANRPHLMLRRDIVEAVDAGAFQVYAVRHVDQAMELLTGQAAGIPSTEGLYPLESIHGQVLLQLAEWFAVRQQLAGHEQSGGD